jgi:hypothetical protein
MPGIVVMAPTKNAICSLRSEECHPSLLSFLGPIMGLPKDGAFDSQLKIGIV